MDEEEARWKSPLDKATAIYINVELFRGKAERLTTEEWVGMYKWAEAIGQGAELNRAAAEVEAKLLLGAIIAEVLANGNS